MFEQEYWFLLDHFTMVQKIMGPQPVVLGMDLNMYKKIKRYVNWLPMNPSFSRLGQLLINQVRMKLLPNLSQ